MCRSRLGIAIVLSVVFAGGFVPPGRAEAPAGARQLVRSLDAALAAVAQAASGPGSGLDPRDSRCQAFRSALDAVRVRVAGIESSLDGRGGDFFLLVDQGSTDLGELRVTWARTGARNDSIAGKLRTVSASYRLLRSTYGREGVRQRQGEPLSAAERRQFQRLQRAERRFAETLQLLRDRARRQGDATTAAELERFRLEAERIAWAAADLTSYLNALIAASEMRGEWSANSSYVRKVAPPQDWAAADETVQDLYVDSDIGQVFTVNLGNLSAGGPGPGPEAVKAYQPAAGEAEPEAAEPQPAATMMATAPVVEMLGPADPEEEEASETEPAPRQPAEAVAEEEEDPVDAAPAAAAKDSTADSKADPKAAVVPDKPAAAKGNAAQPAVPTPPPPPPIG